LIAKPPKLLSLKPQPLPTPEAEHLTKNISIRNWNATELRSDSEMQGRFITEEMQEERKL
jgi:hypothetical protein